LGCDLPKNTILTIHSLDEGRNGRGVANFAQSPGRNPTDPPISVLQSFNQSRYGGPVASLAEGFDGSNTYIAFFVFESFD
jgi:hypothetical protein